MKKCLDCRCSIDDSGGRKRCNDCAYTHHKKHTAEMRRSRTHDLYWQPRNCSRCGTLFTPIQSTDAGQSPKRCPNCPYYTPKPFLPCDRCGCSMHKRSKYCDICKPISLKEQKERNRPEPKPMNNCVRCGGSTRLVTCGKCVTAARRRQAARLRNFRDRLFQTLVHTPVDVEYILNLLDSPCVYCGSTENITIKHAVPLIRGGAHSIGNLVAACWSCNSKKQSKTPEEFLAHGT